MRGFSWMKWSCRAGVVVVAVGCGDEATLPGEVAPAEGPGDAEQSSEDGVDPFAMANQAPGYEQREYPPPPYGVGVGEIIQDHEFLGWSDPASAGYQVDQADVVRLSDFYDPLGEKGIELLMINAVTVWCAVCRTEYTHLANEGTYQQLKPRGLEILGILFEDNAGDPARYNDLVGWARTYRVDFPFVMDPGFKSSIYFDRAGTPMNMVVDARTMQILSVTTGYSPEIYGQIEQVLVQRGR